MKSIHPRFTLKAKAKAKDDNISTITILRLSAGIIWFVRDISTLLCQMFAGAFVDSFEHKQTLLVLATASASIAATSMVFSQNFAFLVVEVNYRRSVYMLSNTMQEQCCSWFDRKRNFS